MCYALINFRVHLIEESTFALYTDHASLRIAMKRPQLSQRMTQWLTFISTTSSCNTIPGETKMLADALSRRPDVLTTIPGL